PRGDAAVRYQEVMGHIHLATQRSVHSLNMIGVLLYQLCALGLRLWRVRLEALTLSSRHAMHQSLLRELDHVTEPAILVCRRQRGVAPAGSVREGLRALGFSAGSWHCLARRARGI